jgi:hypothetical protein
MLSETIKLRLAERFAASPQEFHNRRIVFWHDDDGEFSDEVDTLSSLSTTTLSTRRLPTIWNVHFLHIPFFA